MELPTVESASAVKGRAFFKFRTSTTGFIGNPEMSDITRNRLQKYTPLFSQNLGSDLYTQIFVVTTFSLVFLQNKNAS